MDKITSFMGHTPHSKSYTFNTSNWSQSFHSARKKRYSDSPPGNSRQLPATPGDARQRGFSCLVTAVANPQPFLDSFFLSAMRVLVS
jgi:hypothetical protein